MMSEGKKEVIPYQLLLGCWGSKIQLKTCVKIDRGNETYLVRVKLHCHLSIILFNVIRIGIWFNTKELIKFCFLYSC